MREGTSAPRGSVVIPAHDEEAVIGRCLTALLDGVEPGELDVLVVANGCTDGTAAVARAFPGVRVLETERPGKANALRMGDAACLSDVRCYLDADVELAGVLRIVEALAAGTHPAAGPQRVADLQGASALTRQYYAVWFALPWWGTALGSGVYALSAAGRARFAEFPEQVADDLFVAQLFAPDEALRVDGATAVVRPPRTLRSVLDVRTRVHAGNAALRSWRSAPGAPSTVVHEPPAGSPLAVLRQEPRLWLGVAVYLAVNAAAKARARLLRRAGRGERWLRDDTARRAEVSGG